MSDATLDKRAARIARRIEADIIRRGWPVGESLGSEQTLQELHGASRSVVREAVRLVEHHQVARMRRGPGGGLVVTAPDAAPASRAMVIYLEFLGSTIDELLDARTVLEPLAAELAAGHIDESGIARLRGVLREVPPDPVGGDFHVALAKLTGNPVLEMFVDVLTRLTGRYAAGAHGPPTGAMAETVGRLDVDHQGIVEAVTGGDSARAKTLTERHVQTVTGWLNQMNRPAGRPGRTARAAAAGKRAEVVAAEIQQDIAAAGWPVDAVFGTEADLLDRYGVSRSVLREAVRLLEYHAVARMRRGPGGGLVITEPQPDAIIDTIALYLEYRRPSRADLALIRDVIEVNNVTTVVTRRRDADVAAFLASHGQLPEASTAAGPDQAGLVEFFFHSELAELAGNRVLNLFLRILVELFRRHWTPTMQPMPEASDAAEMHRAHSRIVAAIRAGDDSMARHRSRRHLEALSSWWV